MDVTKLLDALHLKAWMFLALALAAGLVLIAPPSILASLGMTEVIQSGRWVVGGVFIGSISALAAQGISWAGSRSSGWIRENVQMRRRRVKLESLSPAEREVMQGYLLRETKTQEMSFSDGLPAGLEAAQIIYRASSLGRGFDEFAYNIEPQEASRDHWTRHEKRAVLPESNILDISI